MLRSSLRSLVFLAAVIGLCSTLPAADDPEIAKIAGKWKGTTDKWEEVWTFTHKDGKWEVSAVYTSKGEEIGTAKGTKVAYKDGILSWSLEFTKRPDPSANPGPMTFQI